jgi:hypothetical protein
VRDTVTPPPTRSARIIAALQRLDGNADPVLIERHATLIHGAMLGLLAAYRARGFDIGRDSAGYYARPKTSTAGPARELAELAAKCRKAAAGKIGREAWATIWAAQPERIKALWKPKLIKTAEGRTIDRRTLALGFKAEGFATIAPKPEIVQAAIEAALKKITAASNKKTRRRNADEAEAIAAIRAAYQTITGHKGGRVISVGKLAGRLNRLGREIDGVFGTKLFSVKDSKRLR